MTPLELAGVAHSLRARCCNYNFNYNCNYNFLCVACWGVGLCVFA